MYRDQIKDLLVIQVYRGLPVGHQVAQVFKDHQEVHPGVPVFKGPLAARQEVQAYKDHLEAHQEVLVFRDLQEIQEADLQVVHPEVPVRGVHQVQKVIVEEDNNLPLT